MTTIQQNIPLRYILQEHILATAQGKQSYNQLITFSRTLNIQAKEENDIPLMQSLAVLDFLGKANG